ncbi:MAG: glycosyltransferase family 2 protein [Holosporaceae bacterium]|jgi:glycosyltransferase involved in cell wall biosynthesis|nr:glycosyltransferase family 2 protein [Holosporaceae bacterium]
MIDISIIVPFYNESESIDGFFSAIMPILKRLKLSFEILCINDGSKDGTLEQLIRKKKQFPQLKIINFSRNFGKDAAITAGIDFAEGNCAIPIDCDLQDPPDLIADMVKKWREGFDMVLAKRSDRSEDSSLKRITAGMFYRVYNLLSDTELPENVGDFRLLDRRVIDAVKAFPERRRFMKGLFAFAGFKTTSIEYKRPERSKGTSKWSYWRLWGYAVDGITSFSIFPLKISIYLGMLVTFLAFSRGLWIFFRTVFCGVDVPGYASTTVALLLLGGIQLMSLGVIGEYIGGIYNESKKRPIYIVRDVI